MFVQDFFVHLSHLCLVFELLSLNLYEVIRRNKFRGFTLALVRVLVLQVREFSERKKEATFANPMGDAALYLAWFRNLSAIRHLLLMD